MLSLKKKLLISAGRRTRPQDVFATSLYTGQNSPQSITNGLDLAGKGGLVWGKYRTNPAGYGSNAQNHMLFDTVRGNTRQLSTNLTDAEVTYSTPGYTFGSSGFTAQGDYLGSGPYTNIPPNTYVAWAFRQARGFLSIVTYTGNGVAGRQIPHDLGVVPGMIVVKSRSQPREWYVHHRGIHPQTWTGTKTGALILDKPDANNTSWGVFGTVTNAYFEVGRGNNDINATGETYVAYVFAHNPDLIDCGSYTGNGSATGPVVTCGSGWEPQFVLIKNASAAGDWWLTDKTLTTAARGSAASWTGLDSEPYLRPNLSNAEQVNDYIRATSSGFGLVSGSTAVNAAGNQYVYMAIRSAA